MYTLLCLCMTQIPVVGEASAQTWSLANADKEVQVIRVESIPVIDGRIDEAFWFVSIIVRRLFAPAVCCCCVAKSLWWHTAIDQSLVLRCNCQLSKTRYENDMTEEHDSNQHAGMDVTDLRRSATGLTLEREDLEEDPFKQFEGWFHAICETDVLDPNAMNLSTVDEHHRPSCRTVLLKYFDDRGFVFFTNLASNKATQMDANSNVSLLFFWPSFGRQVGIRGTATKIPTGETLRYFMTRPRGSQIGAWVSTQSSIISSRSMLEAKFDEIKRKFADREVPVPSFWGGYRVVPDEIEFWQGRKNRLHDRFLYSKQVQGWSIERLAP